MENKVNDVEKAQADFARAFRPLNETSRRERLRETVQCLTHYDKLIARLYQVRARLGEKHPRRVRMEESSALATQQMLAICASRKQDDKENFYVRYRRIWRENIGMALLCTVIFVASIVVSWWIVKQDPRNASAFVSDTMLEKVIANERWFDELQQNPLVSGFLIAKNNIQVAINCFLAGALLGLGGVVLLAYNGFILGGLLSFCSFYAFESELTKFVLSHGVLEMSIIVAAAFSGMLVGRVFYMRPYSLFRYRWRVASREAFTVVLGVLPWLVLAASLEVFVSPWPYFSFEMRVFIGTIAGVLFWLWTFWPLPSSSKL